MRAVGSTPRHHSELGRWDPRKPTVTKKARVAMTGNDAEPVRSPPQRGAPGPQFVPRPQFVPPPLPPPLPPPPPVSYPPYYSPLGDVAASRFQGPYAFGASWPGFVGPFTLPPEPAPQPAPAPRPGTHADEPEEPRQGNSTGSNAWNIDTSRFHCPYPFSAPWHGFVGPHHVIPPAPPQHTRKNEPEQPRQGSSAASNAWSSVGSRFQGPYYPFSVPPPGVPGVVDPHAVLPPTPAVEPTPAPGPEAAALPPTSEDEPLEAEPSEDEPAEDEPLPEHEPAEAEPPEAEPPEDEPLPEPEPAEDEAPAEDTPVVKKEPAEEDEASLAGSNDTESSSRSKPPRRVPWPGLPGVVDPNMVLPPTPPLQAEDESRTPVQTPEEEEEPWWRKGPNFGPSNSRYAKYTRAQKHALLDAVCEVQETMTKGKHDWDGVAKKFNVIAGEKGWPVRTASALKTVRHGRV